MMKKIFNRIYKSETRRIRPNNRLRHELKKKLGIGSKLTNMFRVRYLVPAGVTLMIALVAITTYAPHQTQIVTNRIATITDLGQDDWRYSPGSYEESTMFGLGGGTSLGLNSSAIGLGAPQAAIAPPATKLGLAVGGSKDVVNFRKNIENGHLPKTTALTVEGLYYEYFFDTTTRQGCEELFCPTYLRAISPDPLSGDDNHYLAIGLNSGMDVADFGRKPLDLVVVLDISGSMSSTISNYYYDDKGLRMLDELEPSKTKMDAATEAIVALMDHLENDDRLGIVLFDDRSYLAKPLTKIGDTDMASIREHVLELSPQGGTDLESGMIEADTLFDEIEDEKGRERRVIVLTDAMPNRGIYGRQDFIKIMEDDAEREVYTTFIGIGLDFQTDLVESITKVRGANYYSVFTVDEFSDRMDKNFDYMVTPLVFDLKLRLDAAGFEIEEVYGSPEADEATGELMHVRTLFPSETTTEGSRGGIIVLRLKKTSDAQDITLTAEYTDTDGIRHTTVATASFEGMDAATYDNHGVRKGILLARYSDLLKSWIVDELRKNSARKEIVPLVTDAHGILPFPDDIIWPLSQWERESTPLSVSAEYSASFTAFKDHMRSELDIIQDDDLLREVELLGKLIKLAK